jgi:hypothetical protein
MDAVPRRTREAAGDDARLLLLRRVVSRLLGRTGSRVGMRSRR